MDYNRGLASTVKKMPAWVPQEAKRYLDHTEHGQTIRELARTGGCAPSTVMRQVRKIEMKRDDPLIDEALSSLSHCHVTHTSAPIAATSRNATRSKDTPTMSKHTDFSDSAATTPPDDATIEREARRILRRLSEPGVCLAVAKDMEKAVVVRDLPDGRTTRTAVLDRSIAQAMALKDWISSQAKARSPATLLRLQGVLNLNALLPRTKARVLVFRSRRIIFWAGDSLARWQRLCCGGKAKAHPL